MSNDVLVVALCLFLRFGLGDDVFYGPRKNWERKQNTTASALYVFFFFFPAHFGLGAILLLSLEQAASGKIIMLALWVVWMVYIISRTGRLLRKLPYVPTRFHQLVHRFFALQVGAMVESKNTRITMFAAIFEAGRASDHFAVWDGKDAPGSQSG